MREQTALLTEFNTNNDLVSEPLERKKREDEKQLQVLDSFKLPSRNWEVLIDDFNKSSKSKFPLTSLQCKVIVEYVKRNIPVEFLFKTLGINKQRYNTLVGKAREMEEALETLAIKPSLSDDEYDQFQMLMRNPLRILISDIERAEGLADLADWERFNDESMKNVDLMMAKMKSKFRERFSERQESQGSINVQINVGGDWVEDLIK